MSDLLKPDVYVIRKGRPDGFSFWIEIDKEPVLVSFKNNRYECPTPAHAEQIAKLMGKPDFTQNIQKVDLEAGIAIARAHMEGSSNSAIKGGATTESMKMMINKVASDDVQAVAEQLAKEENLMVTHNVVQPKPAAPANPSLGLNLNPSPIGTPE